MTQYTFSITYIVRYKIGVSYVHKNKNIYFFFQTNTYYYVKHGECRKLSIKMA